MTTLYETEFVLDDDSHESLHAVPDGQAKGWDGEEQEGYGEAAGDFPEELLIDESEWQSLIEQREANEQQLSQQMIAAGLPCKSQEQTELCWANSPTHIEEIIRVQQNEPMVILSPASVAGPINGYRNQGGYLTKALQQLISAGAVPVDLWPANAIDKSYMTLDNRQLALNYRIEKWIGLQKANLNQLVSLLLRDIPVSIGLPWWKHVVTAYDAVWVNGRIGIRFRNSWGMKWGHLGFAVLQGNKMYFDSAVAAMTAVTAAKE
jgi:hypothetical protein